MTDSPFAPLLELQQLDIRLTQIQHKLDHLPARSLLRSTEAKATEHREIVATVEAERHQVAAEQKRLEDELAILEAKITQEDAKLYSGTIQSAKELQGINDELASLRHRQSDYEDTILAVLDQLEPLDAQLADLAKAGVALDQEVAVATIALAEAEAEAVADLQTTTINRLTATADISDDRLALYDKLRTNVSGNAVALLSGGSCTGCHLGLPSAEVARLRKLAPDEPAFCEECGALLVR